MDDDFPPLPLPFHTKLPDGSPVLVEAVRIPDLTGGLLLHYREVWQVLPAGVADEETSRWVPALGVDHVPELALEEAWHETLVRRRAHLEPGFQLPLRPRFLVLQENSDLALHKLSRAVWSATYDTLAAAREGYTARCEEFSAANGYSGRIMLFDREARRCLAASFPECQPEPGRDPAAEFWLLPRRGRYTGSRADDTPPLEHAQAGISGGRNSPVTAVPTEIQDDMDAIVGWAHGGSAAEEARSRLCDYIENETDYAASGDLVDFVTALPPHALPSMDDLNDIDDDEVRQALDIPTGSAIGEADRLRYFGVATLEQLIHDGDLAPSMRAVWLTARDGRQAVLVIGVTGYSFGGLEYEWYGPHPDWDAFTAWLDMTGWIRNVDAWRALEPAHQRRYFIRAPEHHQP